MRRLFCIIMTASLNSIAAFGQDAKMGNKIIETEMYSPTTSEKARECYNKGYADLEVRDFKKAVEDFKQAVNADSNYTDAYDNLGIAYRQLGELDSAEYYYLISARKYPKGTVALRNLAVIEEIRKNYDSAVVYYKHVLVLNSKDAEAYYGLARQYLLLGKYREAIENANATEKLYKETNSPYIGDCYFTLCMIYYMLDNKEMAKRYMRLAKAAGMTIDAKIADALK